MSSALKELKPELLWKHFDKIRKIPRCSKNETACGNYVLEFAETKGLKARRDNDGNIVVKVPATPGHESAPTVVLQGHLDMVCEKNSDTNFDFDNDAIDVLTENGWVTAKETTLGADNGIGVAAGMAISEDPDSVHGPLELLMTTDEETGLNGANGLQPDFIEGRIMLNLDSEEEGAFSIGCAGGADSDITLAIQRKSETKNKGIQVSLSGLRGGHSGIDIHKGRGNATQLLARILMNVKDTIDLVSIEGGSKHNAIPREAFARLIITKDEDSIKAAIQNEFENVRFEYKAVENNMLLTMIDTDINLPVMTDASKNNFIHILLAMPHGVEAMSMEIEGLVETSNNLAIVKTFADKATIYTSTRSSIISSLESLRKKIESVALLGNATIEHLDGYPSWTPNLDSEILKLMQSTYKELSGKEARVEAIHAGLECGIIGEKYPGMDMISFGPNLENPHSPDERVEIDSVDRFYTLLKRTLEKLS